MTSVRLCLYHAHSHADFYILIKKIAFVFFFFFFFSILSPKKIYGDFRTIDIYTVDDNVVRSQAKRK